MATTITGSGVDNIIDGTIVDADVNASAGIVIKDSNGNVGIVNSGSTDRNFHIKSSNDDYNGILIQTKELIGVNSSPQTDRNTRYYINFHGASTSDPSAGSANTSYYHLKTNIPTTTVAINTMYRFETNGYSYGIAEFIDCVSVGYAYGTTGILHAPQDRTQGTATTTTYQSQDNFIVLLVYVGSTSYYAGMQFSARFTNPTGNLWNLKVLESIWTNNSSTTGGVY
jgi:hypothetical protein